MTSNFSTFKRGDKVRVTGYTVKDGVYTVWEYDPEDYSLRLDTGAWIWYTTRESASVTLVDPKTEALERAFEATGDLIDASDIREGDVFVKQYESGVFSVFNIPALAQADPELDYRLVYRPEPVKVEAPNKLGAVVRYNGGGIYTRHSDGFRGAFGIRSSDYVISKALTSKEATILFEGVDE